MACCQVLGVSDLKLGETKPETNEGVFQKCKKNIGKYFSAGKTSTTSCFLMGNAIVTTDLNEARKTLIERDYPQMNNDKVGQIYVPQEFMSKMPKIVSYSKFHEKVQLQKEAGLKTTNESTKNNIKGEVLERQFSEKVKEHFEKVGDDVLVIHGHDFLTFEGANPYFKEKDFLIVNKTHSYVLNLEIKHSASGTNLKSAFEQLSTTKQQFENWMSGENISNNWKFIGAIGCETTKLSCPKSNCDEYVIQGPSKVGNFLKSIEKTTETDRSKHCEDFKKIASNLLFIASATPAPVSSQFISQLSNAIEKAGNPKNIAFWCHWTPQQLSLMKGIENLSKVLLNTPPSTGKTTLLIAKALELAKKDEDVLFLIYTSRHVINCHRLLEYQIRLRLGKWKHKIKIQPLRTMREIDATSKRQYKIAPIDAATAISDMLDKYPNHHVLIDEMLLEYPLNPRGKPAFFENFRKVIESIEPKTFWIAVAGTSLDPPDIIDEFNEKVFHDFEMPDLFYPLRNQKKVVQYAMDVHNQGSRNKSGYYAKVKTKFDLEIPVNIPLGPEVTIIEEMHMKVGLEKAFSDIKDYHYGVLIVTDSTFEEKSHEYIPNIVQSLRKSKPLKYKIVEATDSLHLDTRLLDEAQVCEWMHQDKRKQDLIVSATDVTGFESEVLIFIQNADKEPEVVCPNYILRAICKLVILRTSSLLQYWNLHHKGQPCPYLPCKH